MLSPDSSVTPTNEDVAKDSDVDEEEEVVLPRKESPRRHSIAICQTGEHYSSQPVKNCHTCTEYIYAFDYYYYYYIFLVMKPRMPQKHPN